MVAPQQAPPPVVAHHPKVVPQSSLPPPSYVSQNQLHQLDHPGSAAAAAAMYVAASNAGAGMVGPGSVMPPAQPAKTKKGVKRKADTTTPSANSYMDSGHHQFTGSEAGKISTRRESGRQIKKPNKDLDLVTPHQPIINKPKEKLKDSLKACNEILKELFSKKHSTYAWPFYKPVDAELLGLHDYHDIIKKPMDLGTVKVNLKITVKFKCFSNNCFWNNFGYNFLFGFSLQQKMDTRAYRSGAEFAADVRMIFTNCYKYNPPDHDVVTMARKLQDVFEMRYAKIPDDPPDKSGSDSDDGSDGSASDGETGGETDDSEVERAKKLQTLSEQLKNMQDQMRMLMDQSAKKKEGKKEKKPKSKHRPGKEDAVAMLGAPGFGAMNMQQGATSSMGPQMGMLAQKPPKGSKKQQQQAAAAAVGAPGGVAPPQKKQKTGSRASKKKQANAAAGMVPGKIEKIKIDSYYVGRFRMEGMVEW